MSKTVISVENVSKQYHLGTIGTGTFRNDLKVWWAKLSNKPNPLQKVDEVDFSNREGDVIWALKSISLEIPQGEVLGIIGQNGSGKSTLLKILSRVTTPTTGEVKIRGRIASLLEVGTGFHPELTGRENIFLNGAIMGMSRDEVIRKFDEIVDFSGVEKFIDTPVKRYSSGMYVRLAFAVAAHLEPEILLVDEVLAVGDINFRRKSMGKMQEVTKEGRTVLFVSHDMSSIRQLCNNVVWLDKGKIWEQGNAETTTSNYEKLGMKNLSGGSGLFKRNLPINKAFYVEWIELRDSNNNVTMDFKYGDFINLVIGFHGTVPQDGATVEWLLFNEKGNRVSFGAANPLGNFYISPDDKIINCKLGPIPLTSGFYRFYISVRIWGRERWDEWSDAAGFQITRCDPNNTGYDVPNGPGGDFIIPQIWSSIK
mgnify:CR=1 FL=1